MKLLAIDTSTEACSAAVGIADQVITRYELAPRKHAELILPMIDSLLNEAGLAFSQLDALAFGRGPGSFTGLRIAAGVIQGIAFGADLPVVPVSSLATLAQGASRELGVDKIAAGFDARMQEVYWAMFRVDDHGLVRLNGDEVVCKPEDVPLPENSGWTGIGSAWQVYEHALMGHLGEKLSGWHDDFYPQARDMVRLGMDGFQTGKAVSAEHAIPVYLRNNVVSAG
jgi:tRNA threonylcarbamoyladenosine biosynthesis protein TsaB